VLNASAALSILGGGSGSSSSTISALSAFKNYERDQVAARRAFAGRSDIAARIDDFKKSAKKLESIDDLLKDRRTLEFVLSGFGLESEVNNPGKLRAIIESDPDDINSFANRLSDTRFGELTKFLDTAEFGVKKLTLSTSQGQLVDKFLTSAFEKEIGQQNPAAREALFFLRRINDVNSTFEILGDAPLRAIVTNALNLPLEIARQSVEKQASLIEARFDLDVFKVGGNSEATQTRQDILNADLASVSLTDRRITAATDAVQSLVDTLENARLLYQDYDNIVDPAGVNAAEIAVQQPAIPNLLLQKGLIEAAEQGVIDTRDTLNQHQSLITQARTAEDSDAFDEAQAFILARADEILGTNGFINSATYFDPNTGLTQNLLRNGTGGALPAGISATPSQIATVVDTDGTQALTTSTDLATFLNDIQTLRDDAAAATFATVSADFVAIQTTFATAESDFSDAELAIAIDKSSLAGSVGLVEFATELDTQSLATGLLSLDDSLARATTADELLTTIGNLARDALNGDDVTDAYAAALSALTATVNNAGTVTDGTTTVTLDNLLTDGTFSYTVLAGTQVQGEGGDLDTTLLAGLPATLDVTNAQTLLDDIEVTLSPALESVVSDLQRDRDVLAFAANTLDPRGALDAQVRELQTQLDQTIASAEVDGKNLLNPFANDLKVALNALGSTVTVEVQTDFKDDFSTALESFDTTVLSGGTINDRISVLNDALFAAGSTLGRLKAESYALNIQREILSSEITEIEGEGGQASEFLKPIAFTDEALKFIERYLVQQDLASQGFSTGAAALSANAALASQIGSILPQGGNGLNILA